MKYTVVDSEWGLHFETYLEYLEKRKHALGEMVSGDDLLRAERFVPPGRESFHDARLESLSVVSGRPAAPNDPAARHCVELALIGPYFDRHFCLRYEGVEDATFDLPNPSDDLLVHEVREDGDFLVHEMLFRGQLDRAIKIRCRRLEFAERQDKV